MFVVQHAARFPGNIKIDYVIKIACREAKVVEEEPCALFFGIWIPVRTWKGCIEKRIKREREKRRGEERTE